MALSLYQRLQARFIDWLTREPPTGNAISLYDYDRLRYEIKPGDVLLVEGRSRVSKVIRYITQSPWSHSALYIGKFHDIEDRELKKIVRQHLPKRENIRLVIESVLGRGTVVMPLSHYRGTHLRLCRPTGLSEEDAWLVVNHAIQALGKPYSVRRILDLFRFLLPWTLLPRRWGSSLFRTSTGEIESGICSTLIAECFATVQFPILPLIKYNEKDEKNGKGGKSVTVIKRNIHLYTPRDFDYSPWFEIIKFPALDPEEQRPYYRRMPWSDTAVHDDHGIISEPHTKKKISERLLQRLVKKPNPPQHADKDDGNDEKDAKETKIETEKPKGENPP